MNVAYLAGLSRSAGGVYYAVSALCRNLAKNNVQMSVFGRVDRHVAQDQHVWDPASVYVYKWLGPLGFSMGLRGDLSNKNFDLIHQHGIWMDDQWAALQWQKNTGRPVIISPHGMLDPWAVRNSAWKKKLVGKLFANESLRKATCIHALCQSEAESIRAYGLTNPIAVIPNGVELPALTADRCPPTSGEKRKLLFLGRIHPKKGLEELLKAWAKVQRLKPKAFSDWQLIIAGWDDGGHLPGLKQQASKLGLSWSDTESAGGNSSGICSSVFAKATPDKPTSDLCFLGPQFGEEKEELLRGVDAFILPSFSEGLPMSVLEAWAYSLPVVMTDFCNLPEGFEADAAIRVEPNVESIAEGLNRLSSLSDNELDTIASNGRRLVGVKFTWERIAEEMKSIYQWCLDGKEVPSCLLL